MEKNTLAGHYQVIKLLGMGGFGQTFLAKDTHLPGNPLCVVKQLKPKNTDSATLATAHRLFEREAEILYRLGEHNQIPRLLAHFEQDEQFYLVQEYIDGQPLDQELAVRKRLSETSVMRLLHDILQVLAFVHQQNVIHRDIKPANLIRRHKDGKIILIDFGAVKQVRNASQQTHNQTSQTISIGSPGYMPSEQQASHPHFSSDIYALGMVCLQALTGLSPRKLPQDTLTGEFCCAMVREQVAVSPKLAAILDKMVRYDYRQRYKNATEALQVLEQWLDEGEPEPICPASPSSEYLFPRSPEYLINTSLWVGLNPLPPLPNSGLFVRRNNQFGTRLTVGIKDFIEQGVLIDQTNIRFDDFVAPNSEKIPSPSGGSSIAVSYGITSIPLSQKRDDRATHYLEIALKASDAAPANQAKNQAPPVNYVFVIDTSGSMEGEKLDSVKESIRELFNAMKTDDVIGIIEFNTRVNTILKAKPKGRITETEFSHAISSLRATGSTDINMGIQFGINEIGRYGNNNRLNHVYLFSDGNPNSGETDWIKIRQNVDAKTRGSIRLSTFAFGSDANVRELDALVGLTGGKFTFVTDIDDIKINLQEELNRREYLAGINVQIKVEIDQEISILYLYGHDEITDPARRAAVLRDAEQAKEKAQEEFGVESAPDLITQEDGIRIFVPDLAVGETYWIVFELGIPAEKSQSIVGKVTLQYVDTFARMNRTHEVDLSSPGIIDAELVIQHALGLWSSEVAFYTLDDLYEKDFQTAKERIANHVKLLRAANDDFESEFIADDIVVFEKFMSLSQNLGKRLLTYEAPSFRSASAAPYSAPTYLLCSLDEYGRVMNGFNRMNL